jgi:dTDP-4-amino-4,6-dideoxygalactose transaminase
LLPVAYPHNTHIWNQYTLRVPGAGRRDALRQFLAQRGVGAEVYYPVPLHQQRCFAPSIGKPPCLPVAEAAAEQCLSIPIFPELSREQLHDVVAGIGSFLAAV